MKLHTKHDITQDGDIPLDKLLACKLSSSFLNLTNGQTCNANAILHGPGSLGKAKLALVLVLAGQAGELGVDAAGLGVGAKGTTEEEDVGLGTVEGVMHPAAGLLDANATPLSLGLCTANKERRRSERRG